MDKTGKLTPARRFLRRLLGLTVDRAEANRGRLLLEPLESRQMLAGDVEWLFTSGESSNVDVETPAFVSSTNVSAEGEAAPDLVAFAKALNDAGVSFFGAAWCRFCTDQKALFEDGKGELPFVEVTNPDRTLNDIGIAEGIESFPTWEFPDGTRATGVLTLEEISTRSGVAIPQSDNPTFATIGDLTVEIGSPLHVPIDAYDPGGGPLTVTVSVSDPSLLQATVLQNNRSARINVSGWGEMVFELFEDKAGRATGRFIELAQSGFYDQSDTNSVPFHRVIDNFVIQGGDPTGTGAGGSTLGDFDDAFSADLQHNRTGVLSYAKSFDDTNDSQFFITEGQQRHLDSNHSVFGQLVEGDAVREAISETALSPGGSTPLNPIIIDSVEIFTDTENSLVMLKPTGAGTGTTDVVFTVTDSSGNSYTEVVTVTIVADANNFRPFLTDIAPVTTPAGVPAVIQLGSVDPENDPVVYEARVVDGSGATATVDQATAQVTVTPAAGYSGQVLVEVAVRSSTTPTSTNDNTRSQTMDLQVVPVNVGPTAPTAIVLNAASDTGLSNSDGITNTAPVTFTVSGVTPGATVEVLSGDTQIGVGLATGTTVSITTNNFAALGPQTHTVSARQSVNGITSSKSPTITVVYDTTAPALAPNIPTQAIINQAYSADIQQAEEGSGLRYSVVSGPTGLVVDSVTGVVVWTPTADQTGNHDLVVRYTDVAGNATEQTFTINVGAEPLLSVRLELTDLDGNVVSSLVPGQEFNVRVYAKDERLFGEAQGLYALYLDMFYDSNLAEPAPFTPAPSELEPNPTATIFEYASLYSNGKSGDYAQPGLINEAGVFASTTSFLGATERFVFSARLRALAAGTLVVSTDPAEGSGHEIALFNRDEAVPANQVVYGASTIEISSSFAPTDDEFTVAEDSQSTSLDVLANDEIIQEGVELSLVGVQSPTAQGGTATVSGSAVIYTPAANFSGVDTFTYTVQDQNGVQLQANVTVTVTSVNDPPTANDDVFAAASGSSENLIDVLANDTSAPDSNETLQVISVSTSSAGGSVEVGTNGANVRYTPPTNFEGTDTFTYTISDGSLTDTATVSVTVGPANAPPTAVNDSFTIFEDAAAADYDVLANDSNDDADETFALISVGAAANGTASLSGDGTKLRYQPNPNFNGTDTVTYTIQDSNGAVATATVTFTVTPVNDTPPAPAIVKSVVKGATAREIFSVTELDSQNVDQNESLTVSVQGTTSAGGTVTVSADSRSLLYTPVSGDYVGPDSFTYTIEDEGGLVATGTMSISVLDYVPREISVTTQIDGNMRLGQGLVATLAGLDYQGATVSQAAPFDQVTGEARFSELPPGDYEVTIPSLPFVEGGQQTQRFSVQSGVEETTGETLETEFGGVRNNYLSVRDFIGATPRLSMFAVLRPGESHAWSMMSKHTEMPGNPTLSLSADGQTVTLEIDTADGGRQRASFPITDARVDVRGTEDGYHLLRVNVDPAGLSFTTVVADTNGTPAEGESPATLTVQDVAMTTSVDGEGEAVSQGTTQVETVAAPKIVGAEIANGIAVAGANSIATEPVKVAGVETLQGSESSSTIADSGKPNTSSVTQAFVPSDEGEATVARTDSPQTVESETLVSTSGAAKLAVDAAMDSLLPQLELRSEVAESLAEAEAEDSAESVDTVFGQLVDPEFGTH